MIRHNFIESKMYTDKFDVVIFCTWCGRVVWDFNKNEKTEIKQSDQQKHVGEPCVGEHTKEKE